VRDGRYGAPAVYLGSLQGIRGLSFRAVRVLGLVEGALPSAVREDAVLSDAARAKLSPLLLTSRVRAHRQLASLDDTLRAASERVVLCAPRVSMDGGARQPAAVLLDVTRALGAKPTKLEESFTERALRLRARERKQRDASPLSASTQLARVAAGDRGPIVARSPATALAALRAIEHREGPGAHDGLLAGIIPREALAGLSPEAPISASSLEPLVGCPHRYLFKKILRFSEPSGPASSHELDPLSFGNLLHKVAERFWQEHGAGFGAREHSLAHHQDALRAVAQECFDELRARHPFASPEAADNVFKTLCEQLTKLADYDWNTPAPRSFVAAERGFGYDEPCVIDTGAGPLYVRGQIDRLDIDGDTALVRDLKTGKSKARQPPEVPDPAIDLQLGLYARVVEGHAVSWGVPSKLGVAYVYLKKGEIERRWAASEYATLRAATDSWLAAARDTLESGAFVRSPNESDCQYCAYQPVCATEHARTPEVLADERVPVRLRVLKSTEKP
jgi:ATP-dependent helicase/DNAse subunit B